MPTQILNTNVPDFNGQGQEICHSFTSNFLLARENPQAAYQIITDFMLLQPLINGLALQPIGTPIQPGDIAIIGHRGPDGIISNVAHSMVVINAHTWFGTNNIGTFGLLFQNANINPENLQHRRAIDLRVLGVALGQPNVSVFDAVNYILRRPPVDGDLDVCIYRQ